MNWVAKPEEFEGETYGQKDVEFMNFAELPSERRSLSPPWDVAARTAQPHSWSLWMENS